MRFWPNIFKNRVLPLKDALHCLHAAQAIVNRLAMQPGYMPEEEDFILLSQLLDEAHDLRLLAMRTLRIFHARAQGEADPTA